jgi:hypothetical protein
MHAMNNSFQKNKIFPVPKAGTTVVTLASTYESLSPEWPQQ